MSRWQQYMQVMRQCHGECEAGPQTYCWVLSGSERPSHCRSCPSRFALSLSPITCPYPGELLQGNSTCSWHGVSPREVSARQAFAPHGAGERLYPRLVAPWAWGDKAGRCWTNSAQGRGGEGRGATFVLSKLQPGATLRRHEDSKDPSERVRGRAPQK